MPSSHFILRRPLLLLTSIPTSSRVFSNESTLHMRWSKYLTANRSGHKGNCDRFLFLWVPKSLHCDWSHEVKRHLLLGGKAMTNPDNICNQRHHFAGKGPYNQGMVFPSSRAWMWDLNHTEGWMQKIDVLGLWCWRILLSPLNCKEIKPVSPKGNQHWLLIGRTDAEVAIHWPPDAKSQIIRKDTNAG